MSPWRPKQGAAKFRGVSFFVESGERSGGRQTVAHEFPYSEDAAYTEDLGLKGREFVVDGYVVGTEYELTRDALLKALETPGPGELIHPYFGTRRVAVVSFRVRQQRAEGGLAAFSITFRESSTKPAAPIATVDTSAVLAQRVSGARAATLAQMIAARTPQLAPFDIELLLPSEFAAVQAAATAMIEVIRAVPVSGLARAQFLAGIEADPVGTFANLSEYLFAAFDGYMALLEDAFSTVTGPIDAAGLFLDLYAFEPGPRPTATTPSGAEEQQNWDALVRVIQRLALTYAATAVAARSFDNYEDAEASRSAVTAVIDAHLEIATDDTFGAFTDLRSALVEAVPGPDTDLPHLQRYTPPAVVPSLLLVHRLYGDLQREEDVIRRNRLRHPGFVAAGVELEILSDG